MFRGYEFISNGELNYYDLNIQILLDCLFKY